MSDSTAVRLKFVRAALIGIFIGLAVHMLLSILLGAEPLERRRRDASGTHARPSRSAGNVVIIERPLAHEADAMRIDPVQHEFRVVDRPEERT